ncbi:MAG: peptidoglycan bridge formation glycyltransferase FemA/FemB family protein [candidate division Zixibacteria bacterium]|nr:peptidoglycan bridge formation glycyltransferase FemA/FemB family protein [candidate division Zixibacteria bacterium]
MNLIVLEEPDDGWDEFVSLHSNLIFHTSLWWKVLKEGYRCRMRYLVCEEGGYWLSALPGMIVGNRFFKVFYSLIPYGGFIGDREHIPEFLSLLNKWSRKEKIQRIQIVDLAIKKKQDLPDFNCVESYRHMLELKGKSTDQIWKNYKDSLKRNIKTALKSDLCFEKIKSREEVDQFYRLYLDSMKRNKALAKYPIQLFYKIYDLLVPEFSDMLFMKYNNQPIAGMVVIYSEDTTHYFHGGSATEYLHLRPNDLLFHNAIKIAKEKGKSYFDFMGSSKKMLSLIQFKEKWGAEKKIVFNYHQDISKNRAAIYQLLQPIVNFFRGSR